MKVYVVITPEAPRGAGHVLSVWSTREAALESSREYDLRFGWWSLDDGKPFACAAQGSYVREYEIDGSLM